MNPSSAPLVLITGATGLVGSYVARRFIESGYRIRGLRRPGSNVALVATIGEQIEWVEGDVLDIPSLETALQDVDWVVHAAAIVSFAPRDRRRMYEVNVEGTANIVNASLKVGIKKFCQVSSVAALGRPSAAISAYRELADKRNKTIIINESATWENSPYNTHYAKSKYLAELEVWRGVAEGLNAIVVNPALILGAGDWSRSSSQVFKYVWDERPFYTPGLVNYVDVRDVADIIFLLMRADISAKRYILSAGNVAYQVLFNAIADCFHKKHPRWLIQSSAARILWRLEWVRLQLTGKPPLITRESAQVATLPFHYDGGKVQQELSVTFRSMHDTLQWCCEHYQTKLSVNSPGSAVFTGD